ncbi:hypothetical protein Cgig2_029420 [Carnegiea gigantea]|uniref:Uncharacterized protein n=1 Tax=Carnegiea gigantea TaxID=171969 RepID=A0A9Q1GWM4_9CARY|nr:hypothetical protein Cgig2_029420 [Carnegiea gigantea]
MLDYQNVKWLVEVDLQQYLKELDEVQDQQGISTVPSTRAVTKERQCPYCPHCKGKFQGIVPVHDEPTEKGEAWAPGKIRNPELFVLKDQLESMVREKMQQKKMMDFTPPSFRLGISPEKGRCASRSLEITPAMLKFEFSPKGAANASIARVYYQRMYRAIEKAVSFGKSQGSTKHMHKANKEQPEPKNIKGVHGITKPSIRKDLLDDQAIKKGKEVVIRQQPQRIVEEMPFLCRSPFLKDYREARDRLKPSQMMLVDYASLPPDELHPST